MPNKTWDNLNKLWWIIHWRIPYRLWWDITWWEGKVPPDEGRRLLELDGQGGDVGPRKACLDCAVGVGVDAGVPVGASGSRPQPSKKLSGLTPCNWQKARQQCRSRVSKIKTLCQIKHRGYYNKLWWIFTKGYPTNSGVGYDLIGWAG